VIVRRDAPPGVQAAMIVHAAGESAQLPGAAAAAPPTRAVALHASVDQLVALRDALVAAGVAHVLVCEPDEPWRGAPMAIGMVPALRSRVARHVAHLPLVRGEDPHA
jgi:hypothetical protein